jgi:hypothetical protein
MAHKLFEVQGSFVCPGTSDKVQFGPVRVSARDRQEASKSLAPLLNEKFGKEAKTPNRRDRYQFSPHFALLNLVWREVQV